MPHKIPFHAFKNGRLFIVEHHEQLQRLEWLKKVFLIEGNLQYGRNLI